MARPLSIFGNFGVGLPVEDFMKNSHKADVAPYCLYMDDEGDYTVLYTMLHGSEYKFTTFYD